MSNILTYLNGHKLKLLNASRLATKKYSVNIMPIYCQTPKACAIPNTACGLMEDDKFTYVDGRRSNFSVLCGRPYPANFPLYIVVNFDCQSEFHNANTFSLVSVCILG